MKNFILTAHEVKREKVARYAAMKEDWQKLSFNQQYGTLIRLLDGFSLNQTNRDCVAVFCKNTNKTLQFSGVELMREDHGNMWEFSVWTIHESFPCMRAVDDAEYGHYVEDAEDEETK
jgi:hypothetical protein